MYEFELLPALFEKLQALFIQAEHPLKERPIFSTCDQIQRNHIQREELLGVEANTQGKKGFDKERASITSAPSPVNETVLNQHGIFMRFKVDSSGSRYPASQKEDIHEEYSSVIGEYNSAKSSKKDLKNIFQRCCEPKPTASSIKWSLCQPKSVRLVNESIDRYNPVKGARKSDALPGTADQNIRGFCQSNVGQRLYRKACENNFGTIENFMRKINNDIGLNNRNTKNDTPLILAALSGHWGLVKSLLDDVCYVNHHNKKNENVLALILEDKMDLNEKAELVNKIILNGKYLYPDLREEGCYEYTVVKIAEYGDVDLLIILLCELERPPGKLCAERMLRKAASSDHKTAVMIRYLLSLKNPDGKQLVNPMSYEDSCSLFGEPALMLAAGKGKVNEVKELLKDPLVKNQINTPHRGKSHWTAYYVAFLGQHVEVQNILIEHGAAIHEPYKMPSDGCCSVFTSCISGGSSSSNNNNNNSGAAATATILAAC